MRTSPFLIIVITCCALSLGCDRAALMKRVTPAEDETFARESVDLLRHHRLEQIESALDPGIYDPNIKDQLNRMAEMFPPEEPKSIKVVGLRTINDQGTSIHNLTLEYEYQEKWLLADVAIKRENSLPIIAAFRVTPIANSLESINSFNFVQKSPLHYIILGLAIVGPIFCVYVLVLCLRTKAQHLRWLWALFILLGVGRLGINWTTGDVVFTPLAVHIPCVSMTAIPAYGPWVVSISLPLGAILFLLKRIGNVTSEAAPDSSLST